MTAWAGLPHITPLKDTDRKDHTLSNPTTSAKSQRRCGAGKQEGTAEGRVLELAMVARRREFVETCTFVLYFTLVDFTFYKLHLSEKCPPK